MVNKLVPVPARANGKHGLRSKRNLILPRCLQLGPRSDASRQHITERFGMPPIMTNALEARPSQTCFAELPKDVIVRLQYERRASCRDGHFEYSDYEFLSFQSPLLL